jgi:malto-oligosyltrehalose trehalohydrolase
VRDGPGRHRHVHLILENDLNQARYLLRDAAGRPALATAQWNDDFHHAAHVLATGETDGYYVDYAAAPLAQLGRCLAEGFAYQADPSPFRGGAIRGEPSRHLPPLAFIDALQTHDQVGNRAFGERLCHLAPQPALEALTAVFLLAPQPPMLFMGEEFGAATPFLFFCDFGPDLAQAVTDGRRREFARFERFADPASRASIPDPNAAATFAASLLDWSSLDRAPHARFLDFYRSLLTLRRVHVVPRLAGMPGAAACFEVTTTGALKVEWRLGDGSRLALLANLGAAPVRCAPKPGEVLYLSDGLTSAAHAAGELPPWSVAWTLGTRA